MKFFIAVALAVVSSAAAETSSCCTALKNSNLGNKVVFPSSSIYETSVHSYWAIQAQLSPACIVRPENPQDVALAVKTLVATNKTSLCKFAIRGGGHTTWPGASNINDGVTIDLSLMNKTVLDKEKTTASVGPGSRWANVYSVLDQLGVSIPGGRAGTVGVAGLTLGGGNSFFAARYGFVCDNVVNYQLILGDGRIVDANKNSYPDIFLALKGGSNNFGIVTRFDFVAFKQGNIFGGSTVYPFSTASQQIKAFVDFGSNIEKDPYGSIISIWQYSSKTDSSIWINAEEYTKAIANPPAFDEFNKIPGKIADSRRITNLTDITEELEQAYGFRDQFSTLTFVNDVGVLEKAVAIFNSKIAQAKKSAVGNFTIVYLIQPIPTIFSKHSVERGGNVLGLDRDRDNLILFQCNLAWTDARNDDLFNQISGATITELNNYAKSVKKDDRFIYLDYADKNQNPLRSYGSNNLRKLRRIARQYDPQEVFQTMVPGGFKLAAAGPA